MTNEKEWQQDISSTVDAHTAKLSDHEDRLNQAELDITDHEKRIDNIETTSDVGQFATRIQAVEEKNTEQDSAIDTLKKNVSDNLQTAKQYTETKLADYATKTENSNTLEQAKEYTNTKADTTLERAKTDASQKYLPLAGGKLSGNVYRNTDDKAIALYGGSALNKGSALILFGKDANDEYGSNGDFIIEAQNGTSFARLKGSVTGQLQWNGKNIVRAVNGEHADAEGNLTIRGVKSAEQDGNGDNIASTYVKLTSPQTISAQHDFSTGVKIGGCLITVG
uniref:Tail-needle protein n=1 Tax=Siphoviridae sp. ctvyM23 TaxID=2826514 RepID=A0A8S5MHI7_9CAUD|nr:MAG TPA: tail-needle protein [Siphoviridae sp. ctvyM23]